MSHTNNFVNFRVGGREFVVQTIRKQGEENKELGVIFTDGAQSWAATVTPALKPRTVCEDDGRFLSSVQDAIFSQNDKKFAFEVWLRCAYSPPA